ncbi:Nucleotide-binding universal stress protein, UspA family [Halogranum gelatinilyticum]|uniref:Nucleotide-binding universal stress protein, UspA family n=1 Tax=Halogranum gelatinilyticum TaxID=660521 RepID=A0A1G9XPH8_9EURY|nr:universal stress protein [Halogranum gelatinilyticum]SDM98411.1 Nucleotide-binding universal stress protein, UspA family [Halogranum gelatinilyticum]
MNTQYERILVPTDGSAEAEAAVAHAVELAARYDAALHALSVVDVSNFRGLDVDSVIVDGFEEEARAAVDRVADAATEAGVTAETAVVHGAAGEEILAYVATHDVDLVVVGTRGRHGLEGLLLGSVAERVVRHADVPVLTVQYDE